MAEAAGLTKQAANSKIGLATSIDERQSEELVFAFVGPIASGVSTAAQFVEEILTQRFGYSVCPIIRLSDFIKNESHRVGDIPKQEDSLDKYITDMQSAGNALRERFGGDYLAQKAVERIFRFRKENGGFADNGVPLPGRRAYILDSLKNIEELTLLRRIYGDTLCVMGVFAPDTLRQQRMLDQGIPKASVARIVDRDAGELATFGQNTRKIFVEADFFLCNDAKPDELRSRCLRFLNIVFDTAVHTPTRAESAMYEAGAAAANSGCMSRQVGSAIVSARGELISIGWNDVPRFGGGLYTEDDQNVWDDSAKTVVDSDNRCFKWGGNICHNEVRRTDIVNDVAARLVKSGLLKSGTKPGEVRAVLAGTAVDALIEFSRSIHAEMEAILGVAREGRHSLVGSTLYVTTYPCHNCARHIVATGIREVVYIEPYAKSLAVQLHYDSVTEQSDKQRVVFKQYDGVAPRNFLRLFRPEGERKRDGKLFRTAAKEATPVFRVALDAPTEYEAKVIADLQEREQTEASE